MSKPSTDASVGFPPVGNAAARVLVLGSLPGVRSLQEAQYYAQPRNAFWRIMGELVGASTELAYARRLQCLVDARIALWDVLASAVRPGSLDARIVADSVAVNDFVKFFAAHSEISHVCFNGQTAGKMFAKHVMPLLGEREPLTQIVLPSTSPAHAGMPYREKLRKWRAAFRRCGCLRVPVS